MIKNERLARRNWADVSSMKWGDDSVHFEINVKFKSEDEFYAIMNAFFLNLNKIKCTYGKEYCVNLNAEKINTCGDHMLEKPDILDVSLAALENKIVRDYIRS